MRLKGRIKVCRVCETCILPHFLRQFGRAFGNSFLQFRIQRRRPIFRLLPRRARPPPTHQPDRSLNFRNSSAGATEHPRRMLAEGPNVIIYEMAEIAETAGRSNFRDGGGCGWMPQQLPRMA